MRGRSPLSGHFKANTTSTISINPGISPIKNSKFMEVHTPSDSYFKQNPSFIANSNKITQNQHV